jgi:hypothetical protein
MTTLWQRAQAEGKVRQDLGPDDVFSLVMATCMAADNCGKGSANRLVSVMCDGLRQTVAGWAGPPSAGSAGPPPAASGGRPPSGPAAAQGGAATPLA